MTLFVEELPDTEKTEKTWPHAKVEYLDLDWEERRRPRRRLTTKEGTELALALKRGTILSEGTILYASEEKVIRVRCKPQEVVCIKVSNLSLACRVAHFLGNWHRSIQTSDDGLIVAELDAPLAEWLKREGIEYRVEQRAYHPNLAGSDHD